MNKNIIILALFSIAVFLLYKTCKEKKQIVNPKTITVVKYDTIKSNTVIKSVPKPSKVIIVYQHDTTEISIPQGIRVDTVVKDTKRTIYYYKDSIKLDTIGYAYVSDTTEGAIISRGKSFSLRIPKIETTITKEISKKNKIFTGFCLQYPIITASAVVGLQLKKNDNIVLFSLGQYSAKPLYGLTYLVKIKLK